nr:WD repeat-containing protein 25 [Pogona vitticeps]XP_020649247.1 WD repeat-containing protein 25 [Pogona vitticeps]
MNSSLVAYDDSDSETEAGEFEGAPSNKMTLTDSSVSALQTCGGLCTVSESKDQPVQYVGSSRRSILHEDTLPQHLQVNKKSVVTNHHRELNPPIFMNITSTNHNQPLSPLLNPKILSGNECCLQKRARDSGDVPIQGLRPYIPKRLRQGKNLDLHKAEDSSGSTGYATKPDNEGDQMSIKTSPYIMPYIGSKYGVTEIPKHLVFQMSDHSGPVNAIQWCPQQKWSHMLLSASMDKTFKVWDAVDRGCCLKTYCCHTCAVRAVQWSPCGTRIISGGFDCMLHLTDIEKGTQTFSIRNEFRISTLMFHPLDPNIFICGGFSPEVKAWDMRSSKVIKVYKAAVQQTLDIMFLPGGKEFLTSTDAVSQDSADRTIIAWDFDTAAKISNQIFHERYTCPSLATHPKEPVFVAQTNGNYVALFSSLRPYRINNKKRYEGHKVEGFAVGCEFSPDGMLLVSGSSDGKVFFYNYRTSHIIRTLYAHREACVSATFHPLLPSLLATCGWDGEVKVWQ